MIAVPDGPNDARLPRQPDYYALVAHALVGRIPQNGVCGRLTARERRLLQPVFDGDSDEPGLVAQAREMCLNCPALRPCWRYATANVDEYTFLAGTTGAERRATWTRRDLVAWRRWMVRLLYEAGAPVAEMAKVLNTPRRTIEADLARLALAGSRRRTGS